MEPEEEPSAQLAFERLFELERGLRSSIAADQQKALDRMPQFLNYCKHLEEVQTATVLRLMDCFKAKTAERRLELIKFLETYCADQMKDIQSSNGEEEFVRRLVPLWEANDVLLKSMILRWFRLLHGVLHDNPEVLFRVQQSLLSESREELVAAIRTSQAFSRRTGRLSQILLDPICFQIEHLSVTSRLTRDLVDLVATVQLDPEQTLHMYLFLKDLIQLREVNEMGELDGIDSIAAAAESDLKDAIMNLFHSLEKLLYCNILPSEVQCQV